LAVIGSFLSGIGSLELLNTRDAMSSQFAVFDLGILLDATEKKGAGYYNEE
jgi:hypothetical protein